MKTYPGQEPFVADETDYALLKERVDSELETEEKLSARIVNEENETLLRAMYQGYRHLQVSLNYLNQISLSPSNPGQFGLVTESLESLPLQTRLRQLRSLVEDVKTRSFQAAKRWRKLYKLMELKPPYVLGQEGVYE